MNAYQITQQIKYLIKSARWPDAPNGSVIGTVHISAGLGSDDAIGAIQFPYCMMNVGDANADKWNPLLTTQAIILSIGVNTPGDMIGETGMIGGRRTSSGSGSSAGRGVLEIEEEVVKAVARLGDEAGIRIRVTGRSQAEASIVQETLHITERRIRLEANATIERFYHPPRLFANNGGTLSWVMPPDRFDFDHRVMVRSTDTSSPPQDQNDGDLVGVTEDTSIAAGSGTSFTAFAIYDEAKANPNEKWERFSSPDPGSTL